MAEKKMQEPFVRAVTIGFFAFLLALPIGLFVINQIKQAEQEYENHVVVAKLAAARAYIEGQLNTSLSLTRSLEILIETNERISDVDFKNTSRALIQKSPYVRNIGVAYGTTIRQVYPHFGNEKVIGINYKNIKAQWPLIDAAIREQRSVVAGPLQLIQGGIGLIQRTPVFKTDAQRPGQQQYLGIVSLVYEVSQLYDGLKGLTDGLDVAIRGKNGKGWDGDVFYGSPSLFTPQAGAQYMEVTFKGAKWILAAKPSPGLAIGGHGYVFLGQFITFLVVIGFAGAAAFVAYLDYRRKEALIVSQASEETLKNLIRNAPDAMLFARLNGEIIGFNNQAERLFGMPQEVMQTQNLENLLPGCQDVVHTSKAFQFLKIGDVHNVLSGYQVTAHAANGVDIPVEMALAVTKQSATEGMITINVRDVSERLAAEQAREQAGQLLKEALEFLPEGIVVYDTYDRLYLCNEAFRNMFFKASDYIREGMTFEDIEQRIIENGHYDLGDETSRSWLQKRVDLHQNAYGKELLRTKDRRWIRAEDRRTTSGASVGIRIDITDIKEREELSKSNERQLIEILESSPIGVVLSDRDGAPVFANSRFTELIGLENGDLSSVELREIYDNHDDKVAIWEKYYSHGRVKDYQVKLRALDGRKLWCLLSMSRAPAYLGAVNVSWVYDIDDRIRMEHELYESHALLEQQAQTMRGLADKNAEERERAEQATKLKSEFLANVSHELRTPMTGILGMADLLMITNLNAYQKNHLTRLRRSGHLLLSLLNDILDFSKVEANQLVIEHIHFSLRDLLDDVIGVLRSAAGQKNLDLQLQMVGAVEDAICTDPVRLRQILFNLLGNALKFTEAGEVCLRVSQDISLDPDGDAIVLVFTVRDTGIGIAADKINLLFEPFQQIDASTTRRFGGTGLGLAISKRLVELLGGTIGVETEEGAGSIFKFTIKAAKGDPQKFSEVWGQMDSPLQAVQKVTGLSVADIKVLIAEDTETNRMLLEEALTNMGYQVTTVCDGEEAVAAARSTRYDAILMDLQMPRLDGRAAAQQIRHLPEPYCNVSIIAVTADAMPNEPIFQDTGIFQGYETKPINWLRLHHTLARVCGLDAAPLKGLTTAQAAKELPAQMLPAPILAHDLPDAAQAEDAAVSFLWLDSLQAQASPERAMAILQSVNDRTQTTFQDLQRAVATGDQTQILYLAHTLKGLAQQFGAHKLGAFADMCEGVYKDGAEPGDLLSDMCDEVARVTAAYGQKLAELRHAPELSAGDAERE